MASPQIENGYIKISNELFEALCRVRIPGEPRQVFDTIIRLTYGYNKKREKISISKIQEVTGMPRNHVCRSLNKLKEMGMIERDDQGMTSIVKNFDSWKLSTLVPKVGLPKRTFASPKSGTRASPKSGTMGITHSNHGIKAKHSQEIETENEKQLVPKVGLHNKDSKDIYLKTGELAGDNLVKNKGRPYIEGDPAWQDPADPEHWRVKIHSGEWVDYSGDVKKNLIYR